MKRITKDNLIKNGWVIIGTIVIGSSEICLYQKNVNGVWYNLYYTGFDENYTLLKQITVGVNNMNDLENLMKQEKIIIIS